MLMDEPFGAVDPIVRDRLQNELLRLQEGLAKTILFVTHDIDEAIKMGDLVAVMKVGGTSPSSGRRTRSWPPRRPTSWPASSAPIVASSGLSLTRVGALVLRPPVTASPVTMRPRPAGGRGRPVPHLLLVDDANRPIGGSPSHGHPRTGVLR